MEAPTLQEWLISHAMRPVFDDGREVAIADFVGDEKRRAELWSLADYRVTSVTGGSIWLSPK